MRRPWSGLDRLLPLALAAVYAAGGYAAGARLDDDWFAGGAFILVGASVYLSALRYGRRRGQEQPVAYPELR